jgi:hypothetical protein
MRALKRGTQGDEFLMGQTNLESRTSVSKLLAVQSAYIISLFEPSS